MSTDPARADPALVFEVFLAVGAESMGFILAGASADVHSLDVAWWLMPGGAAAGAATALLIRARRARCRRAQLRPLTNDPHCSLMRFLAVLSAGRSAA